MPGMESKGPALALAPTRTPVGLRVWVVRRVVVQGPDVEHDPAAGRYLEPCQHCILHAVAGLRAGRGAMGGQGFGGWVGGEKEGLHQGGNGACTAICWAHACTPWRRSTAAACSNARRLPCKRASCKQGRRTSTIMEVTGGYFLIASRKAASVNCTGRERKEVGRRASPSSPRWRSRAAADSKQR